MFVSRSVVIQQNVNGATHSSSGLLLPENNYVITSPVWLRRYSNQQGNRVFSVSLQCAENTIVIKRDAILVTIAAMPKLVTIVQNLLRDACLPDSEPADHDDVTKLCSISLLQIKGALLQYRDSESSNTRSSVTVGSDVYVRGTPFGDHCPRLFMNSVLVGCVCTVCDDDGVLFITDCVLPVGCEGAPVYCRTTHSLIGLVLSSLYTKSGHPSGLSICCSLNAVVSVLHDYISGVDIPRSPALEQSTATHGVVSVHTGSGAWGTGVLANDDIVITCAHVIQKERGPFTIGKQMGPQCSVIYCNDPGQAPDLAILKINNLKRSLTHNIALPVTPSHHYNIGETVAIISYGLLRPCDDNTPPLITKGVVSKVVQHNNTPVMIQTTAVVSAGSSGGIVVSLITGYPIGIAVSYAKDDTNNVTYPRLNFCLPLTLIWKPLSEYMTTRDPVVFQKFYDEQLDINEIWRLEVSQPNIKSKL